MGTPMELSSGIFADAVNIASGHFNSSHHSNPSLDQYNPESSQELGMLVGDGIVLSPNEAQMFKKIQKIVIENKSLKNALVVNSGRLQTHVDDCIQWKTNHNLKEDGLKDQLKAEKHKSCQLQGRLDFLNTAMSASSTSANSNLTTTPPSSQSNIEFLVVEVNRRSEILRDVFQSTKEADESPEDKVIIKKAYQVSIDAISEFVTGREIDNLDAALSHVNNLCVPLMSRYGKILRDTVTSIQTSLKDYQTAVNFTQSGHQIPLIQHMELKHQLESITEESQQIKNQLNSCVQLCNEKEQSNNQLRKERDETQINILEKNTYIQKLTTKIDELENCRSVEILDMTPQQQPKEIKQLEANIESYKKTIQTLLERNETLNNDLIETTDSFDKVEEENSDLKEEVELLRTEVDRLNDSLTSNSEPNFMPDVNISPQQQKMALQHYSLKVVELETIITSLNEELNNLRDKQLDTYQLSDNGGIPQQELLEQLELKEEAVNQANEKLRLKEEECVEITKNLSNIDIQMRKRKNEELETQKTIQQMIEHMKSKDEEIKKVSVMLNHKENEREVSLKQCRDISEQLKVQKYEFETKNRLQKNRESKDADKINNLIKRNEDIKKENETIKKDNGEMRQHIEDFQRVIDKQKLSDKNKDFENLVLKSMDLISVGYEDLSNAGVEDTSKMAEYTQSLVAENNQLSEELEKLRINVQQLNAEHDMNQTDVRNLSQQNNALKEQTISLDVKCKSLAGKCQAKSMEADAEVTQRFVDLQKEYELLQESLQEEQDLNRELHEVKKQLEQQLSNNRFVDLQKEYHKLQERLQEETEQNKELLAVKKQLEQQVSNDRRELNLIQQQMEANNISKKDLNDMQDRLVAAQRAVEKHKRDGQQTWQNLQLRVKNVKDLEEKVNELTTEVVAAKELIEDLKEKEKGAIDVIAELREKERRKNIESTQMRDQVEEVTVLRMQLDVYKNDFQAERDSREKQQTALLEERERVEQLQLENHRLKEEVQKKGDQGLTSIRQRHGNQTYYGNNPQAMDPRRTYGNPQQNYNSQNYGRDSRGADHAHDNQWQQQQQSIAGWQVYGRGNEQNEQRRGQRQPNNRMDEDEQRKCPKCQEILPDLDSLQIHVMECLDK